MHNNEVAIGADGRATLGNTVAKSNVRKLRKLLDSKFIAGFARSMADAFTLLDHLDEKLQGSFSVFPVLSIVYIFLF